MQPGKPIQLSEAQIFANALRECLGLVPLYGIGETYGGIASHEDMSGSRSDEWFTAPEGGAEALTRDEWRDSKTTASNARKKMRTGENVDLLGCGKPYRDKRRASV